jgi:hypothetical protein
VTPGAGIGTGELPGAGAGVARSPVGALRSGVPSNDGPATGASSPVPMAPTHPLTKRRLQNAVPLGVVLIPVSPELRLREEQDAQSVAVVPCPWMGINSIASLLRYLQLRSMQRRRLSVARP